MKYSSVQNVWQQCSGGHVGAGSSEAIQNQINIFIFSVPCWSFWWGLDMTFARRWLMSEIVFPYKCNSSWYGSSDWYLCACRLWTEQKTYVGLPCRMPLLIFYWTSWWMLSRLPQIGDGLRHDDGLDSDSLVNRILWFFWILARAIPPTREIERERESEKSNLNIYVNSNSQLADRRRECMWRIVLCTYGRRLIHMRDHAVEFTY